MIINMAEQSINTRLQLYKAKSGKSIARIALESGLSQDNLYKWVKGTKISNLEDYKKLEGFLNKQSHQLSQLQEDDKAVYKKTDSKKVIDKSNYLENRLEKKITGERTLDFYETGAQASTQNTGEILPVTKPIGEVVIDELFKGSQYAIRVSGNSMTPNYPSGCIIGMRLIEDFMINPGSVYVIETGNDLWIKRLYYLNNDRSTETIVLMSDNKMKEESGERQGQYCYPSFTLHKSEIKNIFRVTGVFKSNTLTLIDH